MHLRVVILSALLLIRGTIPLEAEPHQEFFDNIILPFMDQNKVPGMALAIYDGEKGTVLCYGMADSEKKIAVKPHTIFSLASITKVFISTDLALQVLHGKMALSDPVTKYLPRMGLRGEPISHVTLEQLATHKSSLPRMPPKTLGGKGYNQALLFRFLQEWTPDQPIGSKYLYSNLGFGVLGYALENLQEKPIDQIILDDIAKPLGMDHTFMDIPAHLKQLAARGYIPDGGAVPQRSSSVIPGGGALKSTGDDMLKFLEANLGIGQPSDLLQAMQLAQKEYVKIDDKLSMGLGWQRTDLDGFLLIDKNGGLPGFSTYIGMIPKRKLGLVILANKADLQSTRLGRRLLKKMKDRMNDER